MNKTNRKGRTFSSPEHFLWVEQMRLAPDGWRRYLCLSLAGNNESKAAGEAREPRLQRIRRRRLEHRYQFRVIGNNGDTQTDGTRADSIDLSFTWRVQSVFLRDWAAACCFRPLLPRERRSFMIYVHVAFPGTSHASARRPISQHILRGP